MRPEVLEQVKALAERVPYIYIATAGTNGRPHLASAAGFRIASGEHVLVSEWFCPRTVANLQHNLHVALVVWDPETDTGHQLVGVVEEMRELSMLDGYLPGEEATPSPPQVERELRVRVEQVLAFCHGPHSDAAE